ncbi:family 43 glycosylhydrolase, partial [Alloacidobacterium sp.]|uniref:family 43 glycosylhydrolase n=1 Tax=Alloacidobacterium sp. TaxID=2951999 RepID=UPI002D470AA9
MVGRSKTITGPYMDKEGKPMMEGGGTEVLAGNNRWFGPGGESAWMGPGGKDLLVFHAYDAKTGKPALQISTIIWQDGWPRVTLQQ